MIKLTTKGESDKFYAIYIDLQFGKTLQEILLIKDEAEFDKFIKENMQPHTCIHDVGIQEVDGTITILTFQKFKERYFNLTEKKN